ncbi:hypothetical protein A3C21_00055 [Candidatus Kaiserbacteria bacterium RIFCSPHIGHO2_02_FULL_59_21]|uniref:EamA domain-containing protein n=1 Tax=Candidatus Kaiserbacteria bacterium RIFCSPHIGHO2_02_FULL_59_21 TaxID=1798500 RepID=A0A1F6E1D1_9BACT|nr:MAG: hypothetical protein A2766_00890 [Candidatus Kaiserbacteria bacterium RIFCSPHIGHO2_01_FULL_58_22]OGG67481.1 MAG: hypothetical protein A3C21_00055 [Candidatus Kaiserbacteria bacterium RIFCSPHIGHO2_02_FULL_59_21]OGG80108.1 MAG: hypothetical protein A2952_03410 [Candidatus Kaiserbacteria bacterium RIFCSPLOWO2_01_FULL_59_34]OGG86899.1 MAG: hypothetical protein A3I47_02800 [Candidatus Kaiserbacteria bacterium RIFCSPLOWO2_02_FULL_59_19]
MSWLFVALLAPALSALGSYTDKYLLVHHEKTGGIGSVMIFSSLFGALVIPLALFLKADIWSVPSFEAVILILNGCITVGTLAAYLYAIKESDIVSVVPVLQTIPVFGFVFGYILLGETLELHEIGGSVIIILSAMLLSLEIEEDAKVRFRKKSFFLAVLSSFLFALSGIIFKLIAIERGYWETQFWEYIGISALGVILFFLVAPYRRSFLEVVRHRRIGVAGLNLVTEVLTVSADLLLNFATLLAPIALVYTINGFQPAFLLTFALVGSFFVPQLMHRLAFLRKHVVLKALAIAIMIVGTVVINTPQ